MNWHDVAPAEVAIAQERWERDQQVIRMRECGLKFREIGARLGVSLNRASQIYARALRTRERIQTAPIARWMAEGKTLKPTPPSTVGQRLQECADHYKMAKEEPNSLEFPPLAAVILGLTFRDSNGFIRW